MSFEAWRFYFFTVYQDSLELIKIDQVLFVSVKKLFELDLQSDTKKQPKNMGSFPLLMHDFGVKC